MVFKRMLGVFGVGGPSVDTVLPDPNTRPGLPLAGQVNLTGGNHDVEIAEIAVGLVTRVEVEGGDAEYDAATEFHRAGITGGLILREGQQLSVPFQIIMPWETPVTDLHGQRLHGMTMGLRTEVAISGAVDKGDLDPVYVHPLPAQERILDGFARLGFTFKGADLEVGRIHGLPQTLPFYQEIEFFAAPQYAHAVREVELTFVTTPAAVEVVLEFDKRGGIFTGGPDAFSRYTLTHGEADGRDWAAQVDAWVREAVERHQSHHVPHQPVHGGGYPPPPPGYGAAPAYGAPGHAPGCGHGGGYGVPAYGHGGGHKDQHHGHGHDEHSHGGGPGMGGVIAGAVGGAALGFAGGMVADEVFDSFTDDDDDAEAEADVEE
ncbi:MULTISPECIES: sporulation protein [Catenuloplanes]|uniref:Sporulation-control protein n=1 Tax=Catenuloplanes niger TaxID=587534 RepID=A0AAE4CWU0_9ACTN|nr:sporulation protein [Catenuloplanes niger]MDR7327550.1 sporulation-control protein [Catenuloplanes niger]